MKNQNTEDIPGPDTRSRAVLKKSVAIIVAVLSGAMMGFHVYTAGFGSLEPLKQRSLHLGFALVLAFLLFRPKKRKIDGVNWFDAVLSATSLIPICHLWINYERIINRIEYVGTITMMDHITSALLILLVILAMHRVVGNAMLTVVLVAIAYGFVGQWLPGFIGHRGLTWKLFIDHQTLATSGVYTTPIAVSATYIAIFVLFGAILVRTGMGEMLIDFAKAIAGHSRGGPAKVAVISSGLFGSINGSSVTNVVSTGAFTIPLMKSTGYKPHFAGGVEAAASAAGQLTPPVMGATAFILVQVTGIPYLTVIRAALIPSILFYIAMMFMVDLEARRLDMEVVSRATFRDVLVSLRKLIPLLIPVGVLLATLLSGFSAIKAGFYATIVLVAVSLVLKSTRLNLEGFLDVIKMGARNATLIAITCAAAGIVIGNVEVLGIGTKFASAIFNLSNGRLFIALIMVMITCVLLGMGLPTSAAYTIVAAVAAPPLLEMGLPAISTHLFILYFASMSAITPPVAVASYAGAGIAGADPNKTGWAGFRLGIAGFVVPFVFMYRPALLLAGTVPETIFTILALVVALFCIAGALIGWLSRPLGPVLRIGLIIAGGLCLYHAPIANAVGIALFIAVSLFLYFQVNHMKKSEPPHGSVTE